MNFNFFDWLRSNIRNSVIMGVHDAVDCLGATDDKVDVKKQLLAFIEDNSQEVTGKTRSKGRSTNKKLGRTLKQIQAEHGTA